jgi:hypothetical protein
VAAEAEVVVFAAVVAASIAAAAVASIAAEVMATMAPRSSFARVLAAGGTPTVSASAGGDIGSIDVATGDVGDKIKGVPDNRRAFSLLAIASFCGSLPPRNERPASQLRN